MVDGLGFRVRVLGVDDHKFLFPKWPLLKTTSPILALIDLQKPKIISGKPSWMVFQGTFQLVQHMDSENVGTWVRDVAHMYIHVFLNLLSPEPHPKP